MNIDYATLNTICLRLADTLLHFLWQGAALALVAGLAMLLMRRASARSRYALLLTLFALTAASPVATFTLLTTSPNTAEWLAASGVPAREVVDLSDASSRSADPIVPPTSAQELDSETLNELVAASSVSALEAEPLPNTSNPFTKPRVPASSVAALGAVPLPNTSNASTEPWVPASSVLALGAAAFVRSTLALAAGFTESHAAAVALAYVLGVTLMLLRLTWAIRGGRRLRRACLRVDDPTLLEQLREQARLLGMRAAPVVAYCERVAVPTVVGIFRPMVLLPLFMATGFTPQQLELILRHELAHIARYDHIINLAQRIVEAFLFFHPGVWFISRMIRIEREHCCDDLVLATGGEALAYADSLVRIAERGLGKEPLAAVAMASRPSDLRRRIIRLLEGPAPHVRFTRMGLLLLLMLLAGTGAAIHAATREQATPAEKPAAAKSAPAVQIGPFSGIDIEIDGQTVELGDGAYVLAFMTTTCDRCKEAVVALNELAAQPSTPRVIALMTGEPDELEQFRVETAPAFSMHLLDTPTWMNLLDDAPEPPRFVLIQDGLRIASSNEVFSSADILAAIPEVVSIPWDPHDSSDSSDRTDLSDPSTASTFTEPAATPEIEGLRQQLDSPDAWLRQVAAQQLGDIKDKGAVPKLGDILLQPGPAEVKVAAAEALGKIDGPDAINPLVAALKAEGPDAEAAVRALSAIGESPSVLTLLRYAATDPNYTMRSNARRVLASYGTDTSLSILLDSIKDPDGTDFGPTLAKYGPEISVPILLRALSEGTLSQQSAAAYALAAIDQPDVNEALAAALPQADSAVRASATRALGTRKDDGSAKLLLASLHDPEYEIRAAAAQALRERRISPSDPADLAAYQAALQNWLVLPTLGDAATEPLINALSSVDPEARQMAAYTLAATSDRAAVPALIEALRDPDEDVRHTAAQALGAMKDPGAVPALIQALTDDHARYGAAESLGRIGEPAAVPALIASLKDLDSQMRTAAAQALGAIGDPQAIKPLVDSLNVDPQFLDSNYAEVVTDTLRKLAKKYPGEVIASLPEPEPAPPLSAVPPRPMPVRPRRAPGYFDATSALRSLSEELRAEQQQAPESALDIPDAQREQSDVAAEDKDVGDTRDEPPAADRSSAPQQPEIIITGFFTDDAGQTWVSLQIWDSKSGKHENIRLGVGEEVLGYLLKEVNVQEKSALLRHKQSGEVIELRVGAPPNVSISPTEPAAEADQSDSAAKPITPPSPKPKTEHTSPRIDLNVSRLKVDAATGETSIVDEAGREIRIQEKNGGVRIEGDPGASIRITDGAPTPAEDSPAPVAPPAPVRELGGFATDDVTGELQAIIVLDGLGEPQMHVLKQGEKFREWTVRDINPDANEVVIEHDNGGLVTIQGSTTTPYGVAESSASDLLTQLNDEDWWLRKIAAQKMGELPKPHVGALIEALKDEDPRVKAAAAESLGTVGSPRAIKHLVAALKEEEPVRTAAAEALGKFDPGQTLSLLKLALADRENEGVRLGAIAALRQMPPDVALPLFIETLKSLAPDSVVGPALHDALANMPQDLASPAITDLAAAGSPEAAANAVWILDAWNTEAARQTIVGFANTPDAPARATAISALADAPEQEVTDLLIPFLADPSWDIRVAAATALEQRNYFPDNAEARARYYVPLENWDAVRNLGKAAVEPLITALAAPITGERSNRPRPQVNLESYEGYVYKPAQHDGQSAPAKAAMILATIGVTEAVEPIMQLLQHESDGIRATAAAALLILNDPRAESVLATAMHDSDSVVRYNAIQALSRLNTPNAVAAIIAALQDPDAGIRTAAAKSLGAMQAAEAVEPLRHALNDVDESVQAQAMASLAQIGGASAAEVVATWLAPEKAEGWRRTATLTLAEMGPPAVPHLIAALSDSSEDVKSAAMEALGNIGDPAAIDAIVPFLAPDQPEGWRRFAVLTLGKLGPQAIPHLEKVANEPDSEPTPQEVGAPRRPRPTSPKQAAEQALEQLKREQQQVGGVKEINEQSAVMPDIVGTSLDQAMERLAELKVEVLPVKQFESEQPLDVIFQQSPEPGIPLSDDAVVTYWYRPSGKVDVPNARREVALNFIGPESWHNKEIRVEAVDASGRRMVFPSQEAYDAGKRQVYELHTPLTYRSNPFVGQLIIEFFIGDQKARSYRYVDDAPAEITDYPTDDATEPT